jgi:integrase/recombinase XerD
VEDRIGQFLDFMTVEKNASVNTVNAYKNDLNGLLGWVSHQQIGAWKAVTPEDLKNYIAYLGSGNYSEATVARKWAAVASFFRFLTAERITHTDPTEDVKSPGVQRRNPRILTTEEIDRLLNFFQDARTPERKRDQAMFTLLLGCGLRVTPLIELDHVDVAFEKDPVTLRVQDRWSPTETSEGMTREVVVPEEALEPLRHYVFHVRPKLVRNRRESALFVNRRGDRLTRQGFWLILKNAGEAVGIKGHISPHTLRHTCADQHLRAGDSVKEVQTLLGHASISTTQLYLNKEEMATPPRELATA